MIATRTAGLLLLGALLASCAQEQPPAAAPAVPRESAVTTSPGLAPTPTGPGDEAGGTPGQAPGTPQAMPTDTLAGGSLTDLIILPSGTGSEQAQRAVEALGGRVVTRSGDVLQARFPDRGEAAIYALRDALRAQGFSAQVAVELPTGPPVG